MYLLPLVVLVVTVIFHGAASASAVFEQPLITYRDRNIAVEQSIGSPPQKLRLIVNLRSEGNGTTKIPSACCAECCNQRRFAPWKSSSFREIHDDVDVSILAEDVTQLSNSDGDHIVFSTPLQLLNDDFTLWDWDKHLDGSASFVYRGKNTTFVDELFKHVKPQLAIYVHRTCNDSYAIAGSVAYGTLQNDGCKPFQFQPLIQGEKSGHILFSMHNLSLGTLVVDVQQGAKAIFWSESEIVVPEAVFDQLNATLHASGKTYESLFVDCNLNPGPLTLTFGDPGVTYSIPFSQLITNVDGVCELNIAVSDDTYYIGLPFLREYCIAIFDQLNTTLHASGTGYDLFVVDCSLNPGPLTFTFGEPGAEAVTYNIPFSQLITNVDGVCTLNIIIAFDGFNIGLPFLREYCVAIDYETKRLGFATRRLPVTSKCEYASEPKLPTSVFEQPLITYRDQSIAVEQSIGSPPQKLRLVVDLLSEGNGTTKIAGACCAACCSQRRFAPWKSSSFREINNDADVSILAEDITQFPNSDGDHIVFSTPIEVLNYDVTLWDWQRRLDGSASFLYRGKNTTFAEILFKQVKSQLAIYAHRTCNDSYAIAGSVAYGTLQNDGCNPFKFEPLKQDQRGRIRFSMQKLSLGTLVVDAPPGGKTLLWSENVIAVPEAVFEQLNATLHARMDTNLRFFVDCRLNPGPLTLTFGDPSVTYSIPFSQLITNVDRVCELNIAISADTFFIGLPFLREYCVALDYENNHVGFASHQRSVSSECYYTSGSQPQWCPDTLPYECSFDATRSTPSSTSQSTTAVVATTKAGGSTVYIQPLITYRDANFAVEQSIGYPPQKLRLVVDLFSGGTGTTKIAGACCAACCSQRRFAPWKSGSFRKINNDVGVTIREEDVTQFPNSVGDRVDFWTPLEVKNYDFTLWDWDKRFDGFASFVYRGDNTTFLDVLFNHVRPQLAIYAHRTCNDSYAVAGSVAYGTVHNDGCNAFQFEAYEQNEFGQVLFPLQKLTLGTLVVDVQQSAKAVLWSDYVIAVPKRFNRNRSK